jgi:hypothetical protein
MNSDAEEIRKAKWQKIWHDLPLTVGTLVAANILPTLICWMFPEWRTRTMSTIWISVTTLVAAGYSATIGPLFLKHRLVGTLWAPWQVVIAVAINALLVAGLIALMSRFST